jgi:hypothetical protein
MIMVLMVQSRILGILLSLILASIPKYHFTLVNCSTITKIHKNI